MVLIQLLANIDHIVIINRNSRKYLPEKRLHDLGPQTNLFSESICLPTPSGVGTFHKQKPLIGHLLL